MFWSNVWSIFNTETWTVAMTCSVTPCLISINTKALFNQRVSRTSPVAPLICFSDSHMEQRFGFLCSMALPSDISSLLSCRRNFKTVTYTPHSNTVYKFHKITNLHCFPCHAMQKQCCNCKWSKKWRYQYITNALWRNNRILYHVCPNIFNCTYVAH